MTRRVGLNTLAGEGEVLNLGVELSLTRRLVGDCVLFWCGKGQAEVGYVLHPDHWAMGTPPRRWACCCGSVSRT